MSTLQQIMRQSRWQFILLARENVVLITIIVSAIYAAVIYVLRNSAAIDAVFILILISDPVVIGLLFAGLILTSDRTSKVLSALVVTPMPTSTYLLGIALPLSLLGAASALVIAGAMGPIFAGSLIPFFFAAWLVSAQAVLLGQIVSSYTDEFMKFVLRTIPIFLISNVIWLKYFDILTWDFFSYIPFVSGLDLLLYTSLSDYPMFSITIAWIMNIVWIGILFFFAIRIFEKKIKGSL